MTITRTINGEEIEITLTTEELHRAYEFRQRTIDRELTENIIENDYDGVHPKIWALITDPEYIASVSDAARCAVEYYDGGFIGSVESILEQDVHDIADELELDDIWAYEDE